MKQFDDRLAFVSFVTVMRSNIIDCSGKKDDELNKVFMAIHNIPVISIGMGLSSPYVKKLDEIVNMFMYYFVNHDLSKAIGESVKMCNTILDEYGMKRMADTAAMTMFVKKIMGGIE